MCYKHLIFNPFVLLIYCLSDRQIKPFLLQLYDKLYYRDTFFPSDECIEIRLMRATCIIPSLVYFKSQSVVFTLLILLKFWIEIFQVINL